MPNYSGWRKRFKSTDKVNEYCTVGDRGFNLKNGGRMYYVWLTPDAEKFIKEFPGEFPHSSEGLSLSDVISIGFKYLSGCNG